MEKQEPKKFINISKLFDGVEEENMIWGIVENILERNGIHPINGRKGLSIRFYEDENPALDDIGEIDEDDKPSPLTVASMPNEAARDMRYYRA